MAAPSGKIPRSVGALTEADDHLAGCINAQLKDRLRDIQTDCRN
jgi:hypothetical protein